MNKRPLFFGVTALAVVFPVLAVASPVAIPNAFDDGDPIVAEEFNENFDAIAEAINDNDARIAALEAAVADAGIPAGTIAFFASADGAGAGGCPEGWGEYGDLGGRVPVGLPPGGAIAASVGSALGDEGTRTITQVPNHTHSASLAGTASNADSAHSHSLSNGAHNNHDIVSGGSHDHDIRVSAFGGFATATVAGVASNAPEDTATPIQGGGTHDHTFAASDGTLGGHSHSVSGGGHTHDVSVSGSTGNPNSPAGVGVASVDVTMPYIQLLACEKL